MQTRKIGRTDLSVTEYSFGTAHLGGLYRACPRDTAMETLEAAWDAGHRYFDTAPYYGLGLAERRVGDFLRDKPRDSYVLSTKVGRLLRPVPESEVPDYCYRRSAALRRRLRLLLRRHHALGRVQLCPPRPEPHRYPLCP